MTKGGDRNEPLCILPGDLHDRSTPTSRSRLSATAGKSRRGKRARGLFSVDQGQPVT
jgi:hypothetical protein